MEKEPNDKEQKYFNKFREKAKTIVNDHDELKKVLEKLNAKLEASESDDSLKDKMINYLKLIGRMLSNTISGAYTDVPWQTLVMILAGLLYFLAPLDALPDFIPVAGFVDDATILVWLGRCFREDLDQYKTWEEANFSKS